MFLACCKRENEALLLFWLKRTKPLMAPDSYLAVKSHSLAAYCSSVAVFFFREEPTTACPTLGQGKQFTVVDKLANCALGLSMSLPIPTIFFMVTLSDKFDSPKLQHHIQQLPTNHRLTGVFNVTSLIDSAIRKLLYINHHKFFVLTSRKYATPKFRSFFFFFPSHPPPKHCQKKRTTAPK